MVENHIPEWAKKRACELANLNAYGDFGGVLGAFARYIAAHEEAPVDPLVALLTDAYDTVWEGQDGMCREDIIQGLADELRNSIQIVELAGERS